MTLKELIRFLNNDNQMILKILRKNGKGETLYDGKIYMFSSQLNEKFPNNNFKELDVLMVEVVNNKLQVIIEE